MLFAVSVVTLTLSVMIVPFVWLLAGDGAAAGALVFLAVCLVTTCFIGYCHEEGV